MHCHQLGFIYIINFKKEQGLDLKFFASSAFPANRISEVELMDCKRAFLNPYFLQVVRQTTYAEGKAAH